MVRTDLDSRVDRSPVVVRHLRYLRITRTNRALACVGSAGGRVRLFHRAPLQVTGKGRGGFAFKSFRASRT